MRLKPGTVLDHYKIRSLLGEGGAGAAYEAEDLRLRRAVVIKVLRAGGEDGGQLLAEARRAAALNHPNVATVYEVGRSAGLSYIVMERVEGETLAQRIARGPLTIRRALEVAAGVAAALAAAHARSVIHCDIKSSNVMLAPGGPAKVLDFGLARLAGRGECAAEAPGRAAPVPARARAGQSPPSTEGGGGAGGTLGYMSPEQARGEPLDPRTDIFSLGVLLYEAVAGRRPFDGRGPAETLRNLLGEEPRPLGTHRDDVPLELEVIVRRALAKSREERYQTAGELLEDLRKLSARLAPDEAGGSAQSAAAEAPGAAPEGTHAAVATRRARALLLALGALAAAAAFAALFAGTGGGRAGVVALLLGTAAAAAAAAVALSRRRLPPPPQASPAGVAFRGLLPFQEADRDRFYGREGETLALFGTVSDPDFRFGVLFGESGCGKTSLLRAGLVPKLWEEGFVPLYCRSYRDPLDALVGECRRRSGLEIRAGERPADYLRRASEELGGTLVVVCDQFEEFFINFRSERAREPFVSFVAACHADASLPVKFLLSIRGDFLHLISAAFEGRVPDPLTSARLHRLRNFEEAEAAAVIEKSARRAGLPFEEGLSRRVARDLAAGGTVLPSELQIVGERLQARRIFGAQDYRRAGGKEQLVNEFLEDVIAASGDREGAQLVLRTLISEENTRLTLDAPEIARRAQRGRAATQRLLRLFVAARLVRELQDEEPWRYELVHEYLVEKINRVTGRVMDATQRANRLLGQYLSNYAVDPRTRVPLGRLWFIRRYADPRLAARGRELLRGSLRRGLARSGALAVLLAAAATLAAAALSVTEQWEGARLSDGHTAAARQVAFSPDGRLLASAGEDGRVIVWDFARRQRLATFTDQAGPVTTVAFSADGRWLAAGGADRSVVVWDVARLERAAVLRGHADEVRCVTFSTDGRWLASSTLDAEGPTILWGVGGWEKARELPVGVGWGGMVFSRDGRHIVTAYGRMELDTGELEPAEEFIDGWGGMNALAFSPDGLSAAGVGSAGDIRFWDVARRRLTERRLVHRDHGRAVAFSPDGRLVSSGAENIVLWDARTRSKLTTFEPSAPVWHLAFSPDGRSLVSAHGDGALLVWDVGERERVADFREHGAPVQSVAFSPDGRLLASASEDRSVIVWDAGGGRKEAVLTGHDTRVNAVAFSRDGRWVASSDQNSNVRLWDLAGGGSQTISAGNYCLAISPDGRWVATSNAVIERATGRYPAYGDISPGATSCYGVDFSPDGRRLACASETGRLLLWDTESWRVADEVRAEATSFKSVRFSPDGRLLATGDVQGRVRLWEAAPLRESAALGRHSARVNSVAFSPDGREVASASDDQTVALWDVRARRLSARVGTHTAPVRAVAFSPDGRRLATGGDDKTVRLFERRRTLWGRSLD